MTKESRQDVKDMLFDYSSSEVDVIRTLLDMSDTLGGYGPEVRRVGSHYVAATFTGEKCDGLRVWTELSVLRVCRAYLPALDPWSTDNEHDVAENEATELLYDLEMP